MPSPPSMPPGDPLQSEASALTSSSVIHPDATVNAFLQAIAGVADKAEVLEHVPFVEEGNTRLHLWVDGVYCGSETYHSNQEATPTGKYMLPLGSQSGGMYPASGVIDELFIANTEVMGLPRSFWSQLGRYGATVLRAPVKDLGSRQTLTGLRATFTGKVEVSYRSSGSLFLQQADEPSWSDWEEMTTNEVLSCSETGRYFQYRIRMSPTGTMWTDAAELDGFDMLFSTDLNWRFTPTDLGLIAVDVDAMIPFEIEEPGDSVEFEGGYRAEVGLSNTKLRFLELRWENINDASKTIVEAVLDAVTSVTAFQVRDSDQVVYTVMAVAPYQRVTKFQTDTEGIHTLSVRVRVIEDAQL
jgi:hypothetical protein